MRIVVTGATGFIGRALTARLRADGHAVLAWVRSPDRARALLGADVELLRADGGVVALTDAVARADAVVNLAGEPLLGRRWTPERRRVLEDSRVQVTKDLVLAIESARTRPRVPVSGSAVGWDGDRANGRIIA